MPLITTPEQLLQAILEADDSHDREGTIKLAIESYTRWVQLSQSEHDAFLSFLNS